MVEVMEEMRVVRRGGKMSEKDHEAQRTGRDGKREKGETRGNESGRGAGGGREERKDDLSK